MNKNILEDYLYNIDIVHASTNCLFTKQSSLGLSAQGALTSRGIALYYKWISVAPVLAEVTFHSLFVVVAVPAPE